MIVFVTKIPWAACHLRARVATSGLEARTQSGQMLPTEAGRKHCEQAGL